MRLSIVQIVLGAFIVFAACYVTGWMIHNAPTELSPPDPGSDSIPQYVKAVSEHDELFSIAKYGSYFLPALGVLLLITGVIQNIKTESYKRNLAIINIAAGLLVAALGFVISVWGYPTTFHMAFPESSNLSGVLFINPSRSMVAVQSVSGVILLLGLAVLGVSIAQLVKSGKTVIS